MELLDCSNLEISLGERNEKQFTFKSCFSLSWYLRKKGIILSDLNVDWNVQSMVKLPCEKNRQFQNSQYFVTLIQLQGKLTASTVGQIVGLQSDEIKQIVSEYAEKVSVFPD